MKGVCAYAGLRYAPLCASLAKESVGCGGGGRGEETCGLWWSMVCVSQVLGSNVHSPGPDGLIVVPLC